MLEPAPSHAVPSPLLVALLDCSQSPTAQLLGSTMWKSKGTVTKSQVGFREVTGCVRVTVKAAGTGVCKKHENMLSRNQSVNAAVFAHHNSSEYQEG